jgi:ferrous iron transport protein B
LENRRDRVLSILINPLVSCGARLPVYALFAAAFFKRDAAIMLFGIYATGIALAILMGFLFGRTILQGEASTFVMELPPYHVPTLNGILFHTWFRLKSFVLRAGKTIVLVVAFLGVLSSIAPNGALVRGETEKSILGRVGKAASPAFRPMGIEPDNWPAVVALFSGVFAKEAVVGTINSLYSMDSAGSAETPENEVSSFDFWGGVGDAFAEIPKGFKGFWSAMLDPLGVSNAVADADAEMERGVLNTGGDVLGELKKRFPSRAAAVAYVLFVLIYVPCVAVMAATAREAGWRWAVFSVAYLTTLAWIIATMFYQASRLAVDPASALAWLAGGTAALALFAGGLKMAGKSRNQRAHQSPSSHHSPNF